MPSSDPASRRIVAEARRHFMAHGFRGVTMDDLAKELGMSKKTLYAHFPSKAALLEAVVLDKFRSIETDLERLAVGRSLRRPPDFFLALRQLLSCMQRHAEEIRPPFLRDIRREESELFKLVEGRRRKLAERYFGNLISQGGKAGIIRKDIPAELIIEILLAAGQAIMNAPKMEELGLTWKTGPSAIITVVLEGVITEEGRSKL